MRRHRERPRSGVERARRQGASGRENARRIFGMRIFLACLLQSSRDDATSSGIRSRAREASFNAVAVLPRPCAKDAARGAIRIVREAPDFLHRNIENAQTARTRTARDVGASADRRFDQPRYEPIATLIRVHRRRRVDAASGAGNDTGRIERPVWKARAARRRELSGLPLPASRRSRPGRAAPRAGPRRRAGSRRSSLRRRRPR